jgi:hypothetical protein
VSANPLWLLASAGASIILWQLPGGNYLLYPFTILATWFHEMGHGLSALFLGGHFEGLLLFPNGSGLAAYRIDGGAWSQALIAAGGPLAPPLAGALLILAGRTFLSAYIGLLVLSSVLLLSVLVWVRSPFGLLAITLWGGLIFMLALRASPWLKMFSVQFLGVQACISTYQQVGYLFIEAALIDGQAMHSDTGQIARHLGLPYWFWGALIALLSLLILLFSLRRAYR